MYIAALQRDSSCSLVDLVHTLRDTCSIRHSQTSTVVVLVAKVLAERLHARTSSKQYTTTSEYTVFVTCCASVRGVT
jgi:hypothetical protein